ncbi:filamentous hemagglutinin N-terminal domain-containing protein [Pseudomonas sp. NFXW11]|uniref:two-partner secretion domain-containing protein n=1 Tax=Pseudomonas sp. NFXW11 TaxID=2819531 RepID=UPI003CF8FE08
MDVGQFAFLARQPSAALQSRESFCGLPKRGLAFILANMMFWQPLVVMADGIVVNGSGTHLGLAANGVPIVNIAAPNGSGLSHNQFSDYNVGQQGVILNNATNRTQSTQLGGIILGNSGLGGRAAHVILNEVNGGSPSQLKGYTEVAGQGAHVIVANPYGITCNGCGFINTPQATLTTGKPMIENGQLQRYQVDQGSVAIEGAGLNASNIDRFEIITRSARINAQIQAKHLAVIAGANDVDAQTLEATARAVNPADAPQLAIDSSALGGMYAGAIKLVGTEAGVGVKLDGKLIASGGDIQLDADGQLRMVEASAEKGAVAIKAGSLEAQGSIYAGSELKVRTRGDLTNHKTLAARDSIKLSSGGQLSNQGIIEAGVNLDDSRNAHGDLILTAQHLDNRGKTLLASRDLSATATQALNNQGGTLSGQRQVTVTAGTLDNRGGVLSSQQGVMTAELSGKLKNGYDPNSHHQGGVIQAQHLTLKARAGIDNHGGRIAAQSGDALITGGDFDNRNGGLYAKGLVKVSADSFDNSADNRGSHDSQVAGRQIDLDLRGALNNRLGIIESDSDLSIKAASLDNQAGQLRALGTAGSSRFEIGGLLDNRSGTLESANHDLHLELGSFFNGGGSLLHMGRGTFDIASAHVTGAGGSIVTRGGLTLNADSWSNSNVIQAGRLTVNVNHFSQTASGQLLAGDALIGNGGDWHNDGLIASDGSLSLDLRGRYAGNGRLSSRGNLALAAGQLYLGAEGSIAAGGDSRIAVAGQMHNAGRLTSAANLDLRAADINNQGTLGAARDLTLSTGALVNDHGLVFSGGDMSLRLDRLSNHYGDIYSLGDLSVDRDGQGSLASSIVNRSGSLQSDGSMTLAASTVENLRDVLTIGNGGIYTARIGEIACIQGVNAGDCKGGKRNRAWEILQRDRFEVTAASAASSISTGANLNIHAGDLLNHSSSIAAAGNLTVTANNLFNRGVETGETETTRVFMSKRTTDAGAWHNVANALNNKYWFQSAGYTPDDLGGLEGALAGFIGMTEREWTNLGTTRTLSTGDQRYAAVIQAAGAASINAGNGVDNSVVRPGFSYIGSGRRTDTSAPGSSFSTRVSLNQQLPPDLAQQQVNPLELPGFNLPGEHNGLFRLPSADGEPGNPHKYLIETNPALTDLKQFMSSDYLLANLGYDPDASAKRLGDGFYEQKLIQQAVVARTGQRFIDGQNTDEKLFKYLMDNAIKSKDALNLAVGVTLTSEQVAALTHDIVWLENAEVNGEQVLVPVLYLAQAKGRLAPNGALIAGSDLKLIVGQNLHNVGTLHATQNLSAQAGHNLVNSGLVEAGNRLDLLADNHLVNSAGGIIAGRDLSLGASRGDLINERSLSSHQSSNGRYSQQRDFVDNAARVEAANQLLLNAGRDLHNRGGLLSSGADARLSAGRDVNLTSVQQVIGNHRGVRDNDLSLTQHGSGLQAGRDLDISAGRDISAIASQIEAARNIGISATQDLSLVSAADEQHAYSKTRKVTRQEDHLQQVQSSVKAGGNVALAAGQDLTLISSRITAGDEAYLVAGDRLQLLAAEDSDYSLYDMKKSGSWGQKKTRRDEETDIRHVGASISAGAGLTLKSEGDQQYQAAQLESGQDITLDSGGEITFAGVKDLHQESHEKSNSSLAWTSAKGKGSTDETLRQTALIAQGKVAIRALDGLKIDINHIDQRTISQSIDMMVKADPQLAWLKEAEQRGDVDWRRVQEIHDSFKYSHSSLGQGAMLAIVIVVAAFTAGAASGALGTTFAGVGSAGSGTAMAAGGITATTGSFVAAGWGNAMATAALSSMAGTAAASAINNKGNLGRVAKDVFGEDSLKGYVSSAAIAGFGAAFTNEMGRTLTPEGNYVYDGNYIERLKAYAANTVLKGVLSGKDKETWLSIAATGALMELYEYSAGREPDVRPGVKRPESNVFQELDGGFVPRVTVGGVVREGNNVGLNQACVSLLAICHGMPISNFLNEAPGFNAFATLHDTWMNRLVELKSLKWQLGGSLGEKPDMSLLENIGSIPPALIINYGAIFEKYRPLIRSVRDNEKEN